MPYRNLFIIRTALMTGVFLFAGVAYFGPRFGMAMDTQFPAAVEQFRYVLWGFVAIAVAAALLLRSKVETAAPEKQAQFLIIGWAVGEAAALFGAVQYMTGAGIASLGLGLMSFVFTLVMLPIPRPRR
jgi:hypothetical protein